MTECSPHACASANLDASAAVLIGGEHRSGTTLLSLMLDSHPGIVVGPEIDFLLPDNLGPEILDCCALLAAGDPRVRGDGVATADGRFHLGVQFVKQCHRFGIGFAKLSTLVERAMADRRSDLQTIEDRLCLLGAIGEARARETGKPRWGLKVQRDLFRARAFRTQWPDAHLVHIVRDGRDVAASQLRGGFPWAPASIEAVARNWVDTLERMERARSEADIVEIRYEALVHSPERTLRDLLERLGLPWSGSVLRHAEAPHSLLRNPYGHPSAEAVSQPVTLRPVGRHRTDLSDRERAVFERIAGAWLGRLGYEPGGRRTGKAAKCVS